MSSSATDAGWMGYALTGRPDFLNYVRRGDVTWSDLWVFYEKTPAEADAMVRLMGLFHMFLSQDYDREGCALDRDGSVYPQLQQWGRLAVAVGDYLPEAKVRDGLARLLSQSLISPHYYEAAFSVYLEASLERYTQILAANPHAPLPRIHEAPSAHRRLSTRLAQLPLFAQSSASESLRQKARELAAVHYAGWNRAFTQALGDDAEEWTDEGGEG